MIALKLPSSKHLLSSCPSYCKSLRTSEVPCSTVSLFGDFNYTNFNTYSQVLSIDLRASFEIAWKILWNHTVLWVKCFNQLWKGLAPWSNERLSWFSNGFACTAGNYQSTWKTVVKAPILLLSCHHISYDMETDQLLQFLPGIFLWIIMLAHKRTK
jgi:hypothetical protein